MIESMRIEFPQPWDSEIIPAIGWTRYEKGRSVRREIVYHRKPE